MLYPVGLCLGTYIVCENDEGIYLLDQHAAQERVNYENYLANLKKEQVHIDIMYRTAEKSDPEMEEQKAREREVDYFAGALLMNKTLLEKMCKENNSIQELSEIFEVSVSAMTVRLDILGLL